MKHCYIPQRSCSKVMLLHLSVILFMGGGSAIHGQTHPPGHTHPWADTPKQTPPLGRHPLGRRSPAECMLGYGQQAGDINPTGMQSS